MYYTYYIYTYILFYFYFQIIFIYLYSFFQGLDKASDIELKNVVKIL